MRDLLGNMKNSWFPEKTYNQDTKRSVLCQIKQESSRTCRVPFCNSPKDVHTGTSRTHVVTKNSLTLKIAHSIIGQLSVRKDFSYINSKSTALRRLHMSPSYSLGGNRKYKPKYIFSLKILFTLSLHCIEMVRVKKQPLFIQSLSLREILTFMLKKVCHFFSRDYERADVLNI